MTPQDAQTWRETWTSKQRDAHVTTQVVVCPPFPLLAYITPMLDDTPYPLAMGAQDCHFQEQGAYTGDVSPMLLAAMGCSYVIVGHSERRRDHHEHDDLINKKALCGQRHGLCPIICIGESQQERLDGKTLDVLEQQIAITTRHMEKPYVIAYEPLWAIGTGVAAKTQDIDDIGTWIHQRLSTPHHQHAPKLLYGGSVTTENAHAILSLPTIDGLLVGGASLTAESFHEIATYP